MVDHPDQRRASYDLHLHTCWSYDATATAEELFAAASAGGVRRIAITDHHVIDGLKEAHEVAARYPEVSFIPGAELTVHCSIGAVDMVCLGLTQSAIEALAPLWEAYHEWQREFGATLCAGVRALGLDYTDAHRQELLESYRPVRTLDVQGLTHVGNRVQRAWFIERGFIESEEDYVPLLRAAAERVPRPPYPAADFVLPRVRRQGVLTVIAHPTGYFLRDDRERMDLLRRELSFDGVECAHGRKVSPELTPVYHTWCKERGLISTGGSDLHRPDDVEQDIGRHLGPEQWWPEIEKRLPEGAISNGEVGPIDSEHTAENRAR